MREVRLLPGEKMRVETGPVKFGGDWTGLFIRGDECFAILQSLKRIPVPDDDLAAFYLGTIIGLLASTDEHVREAP
jgi:hypothetical protein